MLNNKPWEVIVYVVAGVASTTLFLVDNYHHGVPSRGAINQLSLFLLAAVFCSARWACNAPTLRLAFAIPAAAFAVFWALHIAALILANWR